MSDEQKVMEFLARFRGTLTSSAYSSMIECGAHCVRADLDHYVRGIEPTKEPTKKAAKPKKERAAKKKAEPADHEEVTTEQVLNHLQILGETLSSTEITAALSKEMNRPVSTASVSKAVKQLLKQKAISQHGQRRGAKYTFAGAPPNNDLDDASVKARQAEDEDEEPTGG
jgi:hypothetical protein